MPAGRRPHPQPDGLSQHRQGRAQVRNPVLGDLLRLHHDPGEAGVAERAAVEQVPDTARFARARAAEVHARQPGRVARADVEAAFFGHLTPARVPGRLPVGLHDAAGNRPAGLVGGLQDQQPACPVEDERTRGNRDGREADGIQGGLVRPETVVGGHGPHVTARTAGANKMPRSGRGTVRATPRRGQDHHGHGALRCPAWT